MFTDIAEQITLNIHKECRKKLKSLKALLAGLQQIVDKSEKVMNKHINKNTDDSEEFTMAEEDNSIAISLHESVEAVIELIENSKPFNCDVYNNKIRELFSKL